MELNQAIKLINIGNLEDALSIVRSVVEKSPNDLRAMQLLGEIYLQLDMLDAALAALERGLQSHAHSPHLKSLYGITLYRLNHLNEAKLALQNALNLEPALGIAHLHLGLIAADSHPDISKYHFDKAMTVNPILPKQLFNQGNLRFLRGKFDSAIRLYKQSLSLNGDYYECHVNLGLAYRNIGRSQSALKHLNAAFNQAPGSAPLLAYIFDLLLATCDLKKIQDYHTSLEEVAKSCMTYQCASDMSALIYLFPLINYKPSISDAFQKRVNNLLSTSASIWRPGYAQKDKIRIGYLSSDFGDHPISHVIADIFARHDKHRFSIYAYSITDRRSVSDLSYIDAISRECDAYTSLSQMTLEQATQKIKNDGVDILVNLSGYMSPPSIEICAKRPSPIQMYWLGHGGGLGLSFIDYVIADRTVIPNEDIVLYKEKPLRLPDTYHCTSTPDIASITPTRKEFGLSANCFVYCAFNNPNKIDEEVFTTWMSILAANHNSQLWLSSAGSDGALQGNLRALAEDSGIDPGRLIFAKRIPDKSIHFARHRLADLFLDTFTYTAATTAIDALWSGLPVLACPGNTFFSRISSSFLRCLGLEELICRNQKEYISRAIHYSHHPEQLQAVREKLEDRLRTSSFFDTNRFTRNLEAGYQAAWERHMRGDPPANIDIPSRPH